MKELICLKCGSPRNIGRRICNSCNKKRLIECVSNKPRYTWVLECKICLSSFSSWRKNRMCCKSCNCLIIKLSQETISTGNYITINNQAEHRLNAELFLGRKLTNNEIVHHIDDNPKNNSRENLAVMNRDTHGKLHQFLNFIKAFYYYHNGMTFYYDNIKNLTKVWSEKVGENIIFL